MKKIRVSRAAVSLIPPLVILFSLLIGSIQKGGGNLAAAAANKTPKPGPTSAVVQVGFLVSGAPSITPINIANIFLNVVSVRLNTKPNSKHTALPGENDGAWVAIPVPANTGSTINGHPGDLQIDLLKGQSILQLFNTVGVRTNKYTNVEVVLDINNPGFVVPICTLGGALEGCIAYPLALANPTNQISFQSPPPYTTPLVSTVKNQLATLPIQLNFSITGFPTGPFQPYTLSVTAGPLTVSSSMGTVSGNITSPNGTTNAKKIRKLQVTAEIAGTNTIVSYSPAVTGSYSLSLPAPPAPGGGASPSGASYDIYTSGGAATFDAVRLGPGGAYPSLNVGDTQSIDFGVNGGQKVGTISGTITDACTRQAIAGATVRLLVPQSGASTDCSSPTTAPDCITVASANTDNAGHFPLPGTTFNPAPFNSIPIGSPTVTYTIQISASGYDTIYTTANAEPSTKGGKCPNATSTPGCNFEMSTGYIQGQVTLSAAQPQQSLYQVFAELTGTNNLVAALSAPQRIPGGVTSSTFTLNAPTQEGNLDLFAEAIDQYVGQSEPYPGHNIIVAANIPAPSACATVTPTEGGSSIFTEPFDCTGHGSIFGSTVNPDLGTTIELSKLDASTNSSVQVMSASPGPLFPPESASTGYSFCAPPDDYLLQRLENGTPVSPPQEILVAAPQATSSPCPSTCFNTTSPTKTCPGICNATQAPNTL